MKNIHKLQINNECYTHRYGVEPLLEFIEPFKNKIIWCPFSTEESEFVKVFEEYNLNVVNSHIKYGQDFFTYEPEKWDIIIDNPPFQCKRDIFKRALSFNKPFALLMTLSWLNDSAPKELFYRKDLQLLMFKERMQFKNMEKDKINFSSAYYCWNFLPKQIIMKSLKNNLNQQKLELE